MLISMPKKNMGLLKYFCHKRNELACKRNYRV